MMHLAQREDRPIVLLLDFHLYLVCPVTYSVTYNECLRGQTQGAIAPA